MTVIVRLKVTLKDVEPKVMRRLDVPLKIRLDRLHLVLQAAMGWAKSHLYEFTAGGVGWGVPDPDFGGGRQRRKQRLGPPKPLIGEDHRLCLAYRVPNQALAM